MTTTRARAWYLLTALVCAASLALQFYLSYTNSGDVKSPFALGRRMVNFFSYFTILSNLLVLAVMIALILAADRDGPLWRVVLLETLICITVTCLVDVTVLRPMQTFTGWSNVADLGLHVVTPILVILGWLLFGPRPRFEMRTLGWTTVFPLVWLAYTLIRGAVIKWYPYPFIDVITHGYGRMTVNAVFVATLLIGIGVVFVALDQKLPRAPVQR